MRIVFNTAFEDVTLAMQRAAESLADAQRQVSTGLRVGRISDDPLSAAAAVDEHSVLDRLDAYKGAGDAASYRLGLADNVMTDIVNQLTSAQTTALSAQGSEKTQGERDAAANELLAIRDALMSDINTQFQGAYLFSGSNVTVAPYAISGGTVSAYQGNSDTNQIDIGTGRSVASTFDGGAIFQGSDTTHVLDALTNLAAAISAGDAGRHGCRHPGAQSRLRSSEYGTGPHRQRSAQPRRHAVTDLVGSCRVGDSTVVDRRRGSRAGRLQTVAG